MVQHNFSLLIVLLLVGQFVSLVIVVQVAVKPESIATQLVIRDLRTNSQH